MKLEQIDPSKPAWILRDARPYGPFPIHLVARDHVILRVPNDRRLWSYPERVSEFRFTSKEAAPISCITQDPCEALSWLHRNEPRTGDLVAFKRNVYDRERSKRKYREEEIVVGTVLRTLGHQIHVQEIESFDELPPLVRITKDSCTVISRPSGE